MHCVHHRLHCMPRHKPTAWHVPRRTCSWRRIARLDATVTAELARDSLRHSTFSFVHALVYPFAQPLLLRLMQYKVHCRAAAATITHSLCCRTQYTHGLGAIIELPNWSDRRRRCPAARSVAVESAPVVQVPWPSSRQYSRSTPNQSLAVRCALPTSRCRPCSSTSVQRSFGARTRASRASCPN
jgi:hypothetical protein